MARHAPSSRSRRPASMRLPRTSSTKKGFPSARSTISSRTACGSSVVSKESTSVPAASAGNGSSQIVSVSTRPLQRVRPASKSGRAVASNSRGPATSRPSCSIKSSSGCSAQCTSSISITSGRSAVSSESKEIQAACSRSRAASG